MKHLGGLSFKKIDDDNYEFSGKIQDMHLNTGVSLMAVTLRLLQMLGWEQQHI